MASSIMQDPRSTQARSAWLAGLTEVCNKITTILNMDTGNFVDLTLVEDRPSDVDAHKFYVSQLGNKLWLASPAPIIKLNGNIIREEYYDFSIDYLGGSIVFEGEFRPSEGDVITASATYIKGGSQKIEEITNKLVELDNKSSKNYKGYYPTLADLETAEISGDPGDYVIVEETNDIYVWNEAEGRFKPTYKVPDLSNYYTKQATDELLSTKENSIVAHGSNTDSDAFYYGGRKTWIDLYSMVRNTSLSGIVFTENEKVLETDSIATAIGKLQAQISSNIHDIVSAGAPTEATEGRIGQEYINSSNGDKYHLTTITDDGKYIWERYADLSGVVRVKGGADVKLVGEFGGPPYEFEYSEDESTYVNSFNGRTGDVVPKIGDYTASQVGALPENGVAIAARRLETERAIRTNLGSNLAASFDGSGNVSPGVTGVLPINNGGTGQSTAEGLLNYFQSIGIGGVSSFNGRSGAVVPNIGDYTATQVGALPSSGGTLSGDLRIKGSGNFGVKLNLGDGDYVHISEPTDDCMELKAKKINFVISDSSTSRLTLNSSPLINYGTTDLVSGSSSLETGTIYAVYE